MQGVNLIPADRREAQQRRRRLRHWIVASVGWTGLVVSASVGSQFLWGTDSAATASELTQTQQQISDSTQKLNNLRRQLAEAQVLRQTAQSLRDQPDWSLLLGILSSALDDDVVLREIQLSPQRGGTAGDASRSSMYTVQLRGFSRSQPAVSQFVLRLQQNGLFDEVKLVRTGREPVMNTTAVTFDVSCEIRESGGGAPR